ncbi:MAG: Chromosome segregation DNA-binding protein [Candidatus Kaiserbacteria bacterium]|nr:Chromosome segregation DNA-binding protein [Candidatus Kaiserbacteria bacterium]
MDDQTSMSATANAAMWKGSVLRDGVPHRCPFNPAGMNETQCLDTGGANVERNKNGCCGTQRGSVEFEPCSFKARRCVVCLEQGRRGLKANAVVNVERGTCEEHEIPEGKIPVRIPATPGRRGATGGGFAQFRAEQPASRRPQEPAKRPALNVPPAGNGTAKVDVPEPLRAKDVLTDTPNSVPVKQLLQTTAPAPTDSMPPSPSVPGAAEQGAGRPLKIPLSKLLRYEGQPRRYFNKAEIAELADDIQLNTQETPNRVFPTVGRPGFYTLIGGERRWRAYQLIAERTRTDPLVDCVLSDIADARDHFRKAFRDNIKRKDYIPRDEADAYKHMYDDCPAATHEEKVLELMREAGKPKKHIENYLLVAGLPEEVKDLMNPDLLDKQLVYILALEIARSTTDRDLRIKLAKEISQDCLALPQARLHIRRETGHSNFGGSGRDRRASDDYSAFKAVLTGARTRLDRIKETWDVAGVYETRPQPAADREKDSVLINEMITELQELLKKVEGHSKAKKV